MNIQKTNKLLDEAISNISVVSPDDFIKMISKWVDSLEEVGEDVSYLMSAARRLDLGLDSVKCIRKSLKDISYETAKLLNQASIRSRK